MAFSNVSMAIMALLLLAGTFTLTEAQSVASCASKLTPCASYLNSTSPPATCCDPIKDAVANDLTCLCNLYNNPEVLKTLGVTLPQALALTRACDVSTDVSTCINSAQSPAPPPPPPAAPGNGAAGLGHSLGKIALIGLVSIGVLVTLH